MRVRVRVGVFTAEAPGTQGFAEIKCNAKAQLGDMTHWRSQSLSMHSLMHQIEWSLLAAVSNVMEKFLVNLLGLEKNLLYKSCKDENTLEIKLTK